MESVNRDSRLNEKVQTLDIKVLNLVLTPLTCASLISEILKCLIYEKALIPYPYNWLKHIMLEHKKQVSEIDNQNIIIEKQHRSALAAYDAVEDVICNLKNIFKFGNNISEILLLIGATPLNPKEAYKFKIPKLAKGHNESNHYNMLSKFQPKILRSIFLSQEWMTKMESTIPLSNLFVFIKIDDGKSFILDNTTLDRFLPSSTFFIPKNAQTLTINLMYDEKLHNCCTNLTVYEDNINNQNNCTDLNKSDTSDNNDNDQFELNVDWIQANSVLKGFKETFNTGKSKS